MVEEPKFRPLRFAMRLISAMAVGLLVAGVWWEYSDKILNRLFLLVGIQ